MILSREQRCLVWLSAAEITADRLLKLIREEGSAAALWESFGGGKRFSKHQEANRILTYYHRDSALDSLLKQMEQQGIQLLFQEDGRYPELLRCRFTIHIGQREKEEKEKAKSVIVELRQHKLKGA